MTVRPAPPSPSGPLPGRRRRITALVASSAMVMLAACGGGGGDDTTTVGDDVGRTDSTTEPGEGGTGPDGAGPDTGLSPPGGLAGGEGEGGLTVGDGPVESDGTVRDDIPLVGSYRYRYEVEGRDPDERTLEVHDQGAHGGNVRQLHYFGKGSTVTAQMVVWFGTDLYYVEAEQRARDTERGALCAWDPGYIELDLPLAVGRTWESDSSCSTDNASRRRTQSARVTGTREVDVGGASTTVWVIERTVEDTQEAQGTAVAVTTVERRELTDMVTVDRHLLVRSTGSLTRTVNGAPQGRLEITLTLQSLQPRPLGQPG